MATAACSTHSALASNTSKQHLLKRRDSRRRQAALLFLSNISLDGRPVQQNTENGTLQGHRHNDFLGTDVGARVSRLSVESNTYGTFANLSTSVSCSSVSPVPRLGVLNVPPILVLPSSDSELNHVGTTEVFLERGRGSFSSQGNLLSPSLLPTPLGPRKSSTLLSVQSCNSMTSETRQRTRNLSGSPRPRSVKKVHFIKNMRQYDTQGSRIVLICAKRSLCAAFSVLPYGESFHISLKVHRIFIVCVCSSGLEDVSDYDPNLLSDPQWPCGKHKRVLIFASYMTTVIEYVKPSDLKKDMNDSFKEKFPHVKLTLSKIRSLKREMRSVGEDYDLQPVTVAMAFVYFEKLVLQGRLNKHNRKLVSAACVLLAAKISSDLKKQDVKQLIDKLEERFRISRRELVPFEFTILVALEMALYLPESKVMPHYRRLVKQQS
ncbi:CDK5 and ABL1 enzyme substrate 2 [Osmerus eperlanus]|uniref:CDK5 and ABL1 enzyme substrate 2 n=1 Tax=Osmerus eperlanus TaxID=29151 RepID=UPI002E10AD14